MQQLSTLSACRHASVMEALDRESSLRRIVLLGDGQEQLFGHREKSAKLPL